MKMSVCCVSSADTWVAHTQHARLLLMPIPFLLPTAILRKLAYWSRILRSLAQHLSTLILILNGRIKIPYALSDWTRPKGVTFHVNNYISSGRRHGLARVGKNKHKGRTPFLLKRIKDLCSFPQNLLKWHYKKIIEEKESKQPSEAAGGTSVTGVGRVTCQQKTVS